MPRLAHFFFFLGLGWSWVREFDGFIIIFIFVSNPTDFGKSQTPYASVRSKLYQSDPQYKDRLYINIEWKSSLYYGTEWRPKPSPQPLPRVPEGALFGAIPATTKKMCGPFCYTSISHVSIITWEGYYSLCWALRRGEKQRRKKSDYTITGHTKRLPGTLVKVTK